MCMFSTNDFHHCFSIDRRGTHDSVTFLSCMTTAKPARFCCRMLGIELVIIVKQPLSAITHRSDVSHNIIVHQTCETINSNNYHRNQGPPIDHQKWKVNQSYHHFVLLFFVSEHQCERQFF